MRLWIKITCLNGNSFAAEKFFIVSQVSCLIPLMRTYMYDSELRMNSISYRHLQWLPTLLLIGAKYGRGSHIVDMELCVPQ